MASVLDTNALVTWPIAAEYLNEPEQSAKQNYVERLINSASAEANRMSGRFLKARTYTAYLNAPSGHTLIFPQYPVHAVTTLNDDENRLWTSTDTAWSSTEYIVHGTEGILELYDDTFTGGVGTLKAVYNAGYGTTTTGSTVDNSTDVPWDLQMAVLETVQWSWQRFDSENIGIRTRTAGDADIGYEITIPLRAQRVFESYKREHHL